MMILFVVMLSNRLNGLLFRIQWNSLELFRVHYLEFFKANGLDISGTIPRVVYFVIRSPGAVPSKSDPFAKKKTYQEIMDSFEFSEPTYNVDLTSSRGMIRQNIYLGHFCIFYSATCLSKTLQ